VNKEVSVGKRLQGRIAVVTGAARGLGRAHALRLARLGADVVVNDVDLEAYREFEEELSEATVVEEIRRLGTKAMGFEADITEKEQVDAMFARVLEEFGRVDILVNNAGGALVPPSRRPKEGPPLGSYGPFTTETTEEDFRYQFDVNFWGAVLCCQAAASPMKEQRYGKIVNTSSQDGLHALGGGNGMPYKVAKAAIIHLTRVLAAELGPYGINVNCIAPAYIDSSRNIYKRKHNGGDRSADNALGHRGVPEDCAKVVEFLTTDLSDYITGQCIPVCGGVMLF